LLLTAAFAVGAHARPGLVDPAFGTQGAATPVGAGSGPRSLTVEPTGKFIYVANMFVNNVSAYSVNATTGALTSLGAPVPSGSTPFSIVTTRTQ